MKIGDYSLGTLIMFAAIVCILLLPAFKVFRMLRQKKKERQIMADATVIDMQSRETLQSFSDKGLDDEVGEAKRDTAEEMADAPLDVQEMVTPSVEAAPRKTKRPARRKKRLPEREYFAAFRLADGERLEIELPGSVYKRLSIGDTGFITYTDTEFVTFKWTHSEGPRLLWAKLLAGIKEKKEARRKVDIQMSMREMAKSQEDVPQSTESTVTQEEEKEETTAVGV